MEKNLEFKSLRAHAACANFVRYELPQIEAAKEALFPLYLNGYIEKELYELVLKKINEARDKRPYFISEPSDEPVSIKKGIYKSVHKLAESFAKKMKKTDKKKKKGKK